MSGNSLSESNRENKDFGRKSADLTEKGYLLFKIILRHTLHQFTHSKDKHNSYLVNPAIIFPGNKSSVR